MISVACDMDSMHNFCLAVLVLILFELWRTTAAVPQANVIVQISSHYGSRRQIHVSLIHCIVRSSEQLQSHMHMIESEGESECSWLEGTSEQAEGIHAGSRPNAATLHALAPYCV